MISKIQANSSNVNFQAKVFPDWKAGAYLAQNPELAKNTPFEKQIEQLQRMKSKDIIFLRGLKGFYEEGIELTVLTKNNRCGSETVNNAWLTEPNKISLIEMYNKAKADLGKCSDKNACFDILNVCG